MMIFLGKLTNSYGILLARNWGVETIKQQSNTKMGYQKWLMCPHPTANISIIRSSPPEML
jgi:hypothetical protein